MKRDMTSGPILSTLLWFTLPLLIGNIFQQFYNIVDTYVVGKALGANALAAVGASYSLMTLIISIITGLCLGSSTLVSIYFGQKDKERMQRRMAVSFVLIGLIAICIQIACYVGTNFLLSFIHVPSEIYMDTRSYIHIIFHGILFLFLYNYFAYMMRSLGNSRTPLLFLCISSIVNILLDIVFVMILHLGIEGAAWATLISQIMVGIGFPIYCLLKEDVFHIPYSYFKLSGIKEILHNSFGACIQQSIMNFGILLIQGLVNTFGPIIMATFTIVVKIDTLAYMPVQEFGNASSTFIAQNYGAKEINRIKEGIKKILIAITIFCVVVSIFVTIMAPQLISIFSNDAKIIEVGSQYLRIEGACYVGIGYLFFFYGYYRAIKKPEMSIILTIVSLGCRVLLSYTLSNHFEYTIIWYAIPIGWFLADLVGYTVYKQK